MIILKEAITGDLCDWFFQITGQTFIQANPQSQNVDGEETPRPQGLYGSVNIVSIQSQGISDRVTQVNQVLPDLDLSETVEGHRLLVVSVNAFRDGAFDLINLVYNKLQRTSTIEHFNSIELSFVSRSEVRDVTIPSSGGLEERHQFDLFLHTVATDQEIVTSIETLRIIGKTGGGLTVIDLNLENAE